jgi:hypothetical protein
MFLEVKNGIADKLSWAMIGDATSTVGMKDSYLLLSQYFGRNNYVFFSPKSPYGKNWWMLQE